MPRFSTRYRLPQKSAPIVLPDMSRQNAINARLGQFPLENEARQAQMDAAQAREAKARYDLSKQIETDRQRTAFYNGLNELEQNLSKRGYGIGSREHAEAFASYAHEFPLARSSADVQNTLKVHALVADDQAALKQRMNQLLPPPEKIAQRYARVKGTVDQYEAELKGDITRQATANKGTRDVPYNPAFDTAAATIAGNLSGAKSELNQLTQAYPNLVQPTNAEQPQPVVPTAQPVVPNPAPTAALPSPTIAPNDTVTTTPTPTHLGTYNPATGEFDQ